jgi:uncharacterized membrane protein YfcA
MTALVHLLHNGLKTTLLWRSIDWSTAIRFGLPSLVAAIPGALLLKKLAEFHPSTGITLFGIRLEPSPLSFCIGLILIGFALLETFPPKNYRMKNLYLGGLLSGFLGGFSGHQGTFRSIFLLNTQLNEKAFLATNAIIAVIVDCVRLLLYSLSFQYLLKSSHLIVLSAAFCGAVLGVIFGKKALKKITLPSIRMLILILLYFFGGLLIFGII